MVLLVGDDRLRQGVEEDEERFCHRVDVVLGACGGVVGWLVG